MLLRQGSGDQKGMGAGRWPSLPLDLGAGSTDTLSLWQSTELAPSSAPWSLALPQAPRWAGMAVGPR